MADPYHHFLNFNNSCAIDSFLELAQFTFFHDLCSKEKGELLSLVANSCALRHDAGKNMSKKLLFDIREAVWKWIESNCPSFAGRTSNASFEEILDHICTTSDESDLFSVKSSCRYICSTPGCNAFKVREKRECPVYVFQPELNDHNNDMGATLSKTSSSSTEVIRETFIESSCVPNIPVRNSYQLLTDEAETSHETVASQIIQVTPVRAHTTNCAKEKTKRKLLPSSPPPSKKINSSSKKLNSSSKKCILKLENVTKGCDPKVTLKSKNVSDSDNASIPLNDITNVTQQKGPSVQFCDYVVIQNGRLFVDIQLLNSMNLLGKQWKRSRLLNRVKYYGFDSTTEVIDINCINFISLKVFIVLLFKSNFCEQTLRQNTCTEILTLLNKAAMANNTSKWASFSVHTELDENQLYVDMNDLYSLLDVKTKRIRPLLPGLKRLALSDDHFIFEKKNARSHISFEAFTGVLLTHLSISKQKLLKPTADILNRLEIYFLQNFDYIQKDFHCKMLRDRNQPAWASKQNLSSPNDDTDSEKVCKVNAGTKLSRGRSTADIISPSTGTNLKYNKTMKRRLKQQHLSLQQIASVIHKGDKDSLKQAIVYDINQNKSPSSHEVEWSGQVNRDDLVDILKGVPSVNLKYDNFFDEIACDHNVNGGRCGEMVGKLGSVAGEGSGKGYFISKVERLKQNMAERCVAKGEIIDCNPDGTLKEKISLNKIDAHALLLPCYEGCCYGPLLEGVSSDHVTFDIDVVLQKALGFSSSETELKVETALWNCMSKVTFLLRDSDPVPTLKPGSLETSLDENDYYWGMSADKVDECILNLDLFHKLFVLLYGGNKLTPYMIKIIDITGCLLRSLPVTTLMRFSTEGGEHLHYTDGTYFHQHTQKGGAGKTEDPIYAILCHKYRLLKTRLIKYSTNSEAQYAKAGRDFLDWVDEELEHHASNMASENRISCTPQLESRSPVYNFYFVGRVPAVLFKNSAISSKDALVKKLRDCKSRVLDLTVDQLPKRSHHRKIIMLTQQSLCHQKNPPKSLIMACKRGWPIVNVAFALQYVNDPFSDINSFMLDIKNIQSHPFVRLSRPFSSHSSKHRKSHVVTKYKNMLRKKAKVNVRRHHKKKKSGLVKPGSSFALFVYDASKTLTGEQLRLPIRDRQCLISKKWRELTIEEKAMYAFKARERYYKTLKNQLPNVSDAMKSQSFPLSYERKKSFKHI
ncbi:hypothetical protein BSL78_15206 [Apostichopus japonicus]|uniref:HMG box domain-containing protein n=1 Tax=Stichopus japonicus TaxID=307972 RepID=A0A2G8KIW5_STIJA|nr:hypothetical protein BSL78_15206 [Apostichopus japonicus]